MRCPSCDDDYEAHVRTCADCGRELVSADDIGVDVPVVPDARLGTFHPSIVAGVIALLDRRGVAYVVHRRDEHVEIVVDRAWRDDLRTELTMTWSELVRGLGPEASTEIDLADDSAPGWHDAPHGGHVDRLGRLVVDVSSADDDEADAARILGPALLTVGAIATVTGWYLIDSAALIVAGIGLALAGLFTPR